MITYYCSPSKNAQQVARRLLWICGDLCRRHCCVLPGWGPTYPSPQLCRRLQRKNGQIFLRLEENHFWFQTWWPSDDEKSEQDSKRWRVVCWSLHGGWTQRQWNVHSHPNTSSILSHTKLCTNLPYKISYKTLLEGNSWRNSMWPGDPNFLIDILIGIDRSQLWG